MHFLVQIFIMCFTCYLSSFSQTSPNIILIYIDDLGWTDTSVEMIKGDRETKSDFYITQNLENLLQKAWFFQTHMHQHQFVHHQGIQCFME